MEGTEKHQARKEIHETLSICNFCVSIIGVPLIDDKPKHFRGRLRTYVALTVTSSLLFCLPLGSYMFFISRLMAVNNVVEGIMSSNLHIAGYGLISFGKLLTLWCKRHKFRLLVSELVDIWPVSIRFKKEADIKRESLSALRNRQIMYTLWNVLGVWLYNLTPIVIFVYHKARDMPSQLGFVHQVLYPFDKTKPVYHEIAYFMESLTGVLAVCIMLGTDLLFIAMASHMSMLLRLLQVKIQNLIDDDTDNISSLIDCYAEIIAVVKIHQRIIRFVNDLEDAFSAANFINVLLSSMNICFCMFNIVFQNSWMEMSDIFYLGAVLTQMGVVCWYADDIFRASVGVSDAVYKSSWYRSDVRCRRALLLMLQRSQKPLYFTALKFSPITMSTYTSVLTNSYSYFALLYTAYK